MTVQDVSKRTAAPQLTIDIDADQAFIVIAEDDDDVREALGDVLRNDGFRVECLADGELLIDYLGRCEAEQRLPDLIVTDHRMPGYSGVEVLEGMRDAGWKVPVIVVTAFGNEVRPLARALGACAVFDKPFDPDDLRTAVLYWLDWPARRVRLLPPVD